MSCSLVLLETNKLQRVVPGQHEWLRLQHRMATGATDAPVVVYIELSLFLQLACFYVSETIIKTVVQKICTLLGSYTLRKMSVLLREVF